MKGWAVALIIIFILGIIISNLLLLKQTANMKVPGSILRAIKEKKEKALQKEKEKPKAK
ncbi:DUF2897 family protein [Psychromonas ingrahamii]|uniref:DUF2897 family protein n=1 Tax=Psychromonas ingrahamii TaxID=357794 RepID=UPI0002F55796|nr:DUF2897 family protein [Psychromonas ingrahamii]